MTRDGTADMPYLAESSELFGELRSARPFFLLAGRTLFSPKSTSSRCVESSSEQQTSLTFPFVFKSSFDKANPDELDLVSRPGIEEGLRILRAVKATFDIADRDGYTLRRRQNQSVRWLMCFRSRVLMSTNRFAARSGENRSSC